jgi:hypothetical protein
MKPNPAAKRDDPIMGKESPESYEERLQRIKNLQRELITDLKSEVQELEVKLKSKRELLEAAQNQLGIPISKVKPATAARGKRGRPKKGGMTVSEAVKEALKGGKEVRLNDLVATVGVLLGRKPNRASISQTLNTLKIDEQITNPERGFWKLT